MSEGQTNWYTQKLRLSLGTIMECIVFQFMASVLNYLVVQRLAGVQTPLKSAVTYIVK